MARSYLFVTALVSLLAVPTVALAQPHHDNNHNEDARARQDRERQERERQERERHEHDNGRPGAAVQVQVQAPGQPWRWHNAQEADSRYRDLQARRAHLAAVDQRELAELEARQHRLDELRRIDAERDRDRAERIRRARLEQAARFRSPPPPIANEEYTRYSQRKATLLRVKAVADAEGRAAESARASELLVREESRHAAWVAAHPF